jgi:hypothetical protein
MLELILYILFAGLMIIAVFVGFCLIKKRHDKLVLDYNKLVDDFIKMHNRTTIAEKRCEEITYYSSQVVEKLQRTIDELLKEKNIKKTIIN